MGLTVFYVEIYSIIGVYVFSRLREVLDSAYRVAVKYYLGSSLLSSVHYFRRFFKDPYDITIFAFIAATYDYQMKVPHLIKRFNFITNFLRVNDITLLELLNKDTYNRLVEALINELRSFHRFDPRMKYFKNLLRILVKVDLVEFIKELYEPSLNEPLEYVINGVLNEIHEVARRLGAELRPGLIPFPNSKSAKKRMTLFFRWVVRREEPDLGILNFIDPSHLYISLDVGVQRVFNRLTGIKLRPDWEGVLKVTKYFRRVNPEDPAKYDYVLSRPTILDICKAKFDESDCDVCFLSNICLYGKARAYRLLKEGVKILEPKGEELRRHDHLKMLFKERNPWGAKCITEKLVDGKADLVCYIPDELSPNKIIAVEVKVTLGIDGLRQVLRYVTALKNLSLIHI